MGFERRELRSADGTKLSVLDSGGDGAPVVILHGLAGSSTEFGATAEVLPEFRVLLLDQRGHGRSTRRPADVSRAAYVQDVVRVIESEDLGPVVLIGQSMGAHTAMLVAAARPDLVQRLVLLEGGAGGGSPAEHQQLGEFFRSWPAPFPDRESARAFLGDGALAEAWANDLEERPDGLHPRFDPDVMVSAISAVAVPRWDEWASISAPTLVVYADGGMFTEDDKTEFVRRGGDVQRVDLANASHDAHLDAFDAWTAALRAFLRP